MLCEAVSFRSNCRRGRQVCRAYHNDCLRHVVLYCLNHCPVLLCNIRDLQAQPVSLAHPAGVSHPRLHSRDAHLVCASRTRKDSARRYLHAPGASDARVRDVSITADLIGGVHNDDPPVVRHRQQARHLPYHSRLPHARPALHVPLAVRLQRPSSSTQLPLSIAQ